jgi:hypothetical protein
MGTASYAVEKKVQKKEISSELSKESCSNLNGMSISKSSIGLRNTGASIISATLTTDDKQGEFCKVLGSIHPVDPSAPAINFQVNLPSNWNQKALQMGGGGFNGFLD